MVIKQIKWKWVYDFTMFEVPEGGGGLQLGGNTAYGLHNQNTHHILPCHQVRSSKWKGVNLMGKWSFVLLGCVSLLKSERWLWIHSSVRFGHSPARHGDWIFHRATSFLYLLVQLASRIFQRIIGEVYYWVYFYGKFSLFSSFWKLVLVLSNKSTQE